MFAQDLLPHLPNFTEMELFQEDICQTLQHCGDNIQLLKNQMRELADTAETTMQVRELLLLTDMFGLKLHFAMPIMFVWCIDASYTLIHFLL